MGPFEVTLPSGWTRNVVVVYEPCKCGWTYDDATLAAYARGEVGLDLNPTHACAPLPVVPKPEPTSSICTASTRNGWVHPHDCPGPGGDEPCPASMRTAHA